MLFVVFAMVVVACGDTSDDTADDVVEESSDTTEAADGLNPEIQKNWEQGINWLKSEGASVIEIVYPIQVLLCQLIIS